MFVRSNNFRSRTKEERAAKSLPLPKFNNIAGNPEYFINMIKLDEEMEHLRDTIFYRIFQKSLLFDTFDTAIEYRNLLVKSKRQAPPLYTRTGERIQADGIFNPGKGNRLPDKLNAQFGAQPDYSYEEFQSIQSGKLSYIILYL